MKTARYSAVVCTMLALGAFLTPAAAQNGKADYEQNCDCHGADGKGRGPANTVIPMNPPPPDLTGLAAANGGKFPFDRVVDSIDGRKAIPSHARLQMSFFGVSLQKPGEPMNPRDDAEIRRRIEAIARYVEGLQKR